MQTPGLAGPPSGLPRAAGTVDACGSASVPHRTAGHTVGNVQRSLAGAGARTLLTCGQVPPAPTIQREAGRGEPRDQADDAEGQDPAGIAVAGIADAAQREEERADAEQRRRDAEQSIEEFHAQVWHGCQPSRLL